MLHIDKISPVRSASSGKPPSSDKNQNRTAPLSSLNIPDEYQLEFIKYEVDDTQEDEFGDKIGSAGDAEINVLIDEQRFDR